MARETSLLLQFSIMSPAVASPTTPTSRPQRHLLAVKKKCSLGDGLLAAVVDASKVHEFGYGVAGYSTHEGMG
jgi:hypothetical protein